MRGSDVIVSRANLIGLCEVVEQPPLCGRTTGDTPNDREWVDLRWPVCRGKFSRERRIRFIMTRDQAEASAPTRRTNGLAVRCLCRCSRSRPGQRTGAGPWRMR